MTRERIEDMREVVLPFVKKRLLETNYENLGESDAEEFAREFNEILDLAIKALEQEPISETDIILTREEYGELVSSEYDNGYAKGYREALEQEPTTKNDLEVDWDELKRKILMEVDGGTDDKWLRYADVCDRISDSIDKYKAESEG